MGITTLKMNGLNFTLHFYCSAPVRLSVLPSLIGRKLTYSKRSILTILPRENLILKFKEQVYEGKISPCPREWQELRDQLFANHRNVHPHNVDAVILGKFNDAKDLPIAKNYIQFLKEEGIQPNYATLGKLLRIYYLSSVNGVLSEADKQEVLKIYKTIRDECDVLDATTCDNVIHGLLATDKWKESIEILKMFKLSASPSISAYSSIIAKAFKENENEVGWVLLNEMLECHKQPKCEVYTSIICSSVKDKASFVSNLEKLFNLLGTYEVLISEEVVTVLETCLESMGHFVKQTTLAGNGKCRNCRSLMKNITISDEEFKAMSSSFLEKVLMGNDIFQKSTPSEVERFIKFVDKTGPYDCVIDGLNVAYSRGVQKSPKVFAHLLSSVLKYFKNQNKYVLVLGRKHIENWLTKEINHCKKSACMFLTNDLSHDDPFLLYATIKSGQSTDFFSRDLMRSHAFLLDAEHKGIFKRWQQEHQFSLVTATDLGKVIVKEPIRHVKFAQQNNNIWHIPYKEKYSPNPPEIFEVPDKWLCIKFNQ